MNNTLDAPFGATFCSSYVAVTGVTATGATTFTGTPVGTGAAISYCINGKAYTKATISGGATPTTDAATGIAFLPLAANQACLVVLGLNANGDILAAQGPIDAPGAALQFPQLPNTMCAFAYIVCTRAATGAAFVFGTSNWNATAITATPVSLMTLPARPQSA